MMPPKSFVCVCGTEHEFGLYVLAHWDIRLAHTCDACGAKHSVLRGKTTLISKPKTKRKEKSNVG